MKKILIVIGILIIVIIGIRFFSGEDDWICSGGQWVRHGNPSAPMPDGPCR